MKKGLSKKIGCIVVMMCLCGLECGAINAKELPVFITQQTDLGDLIKSDTDGDGLVTAIVIGAETDIGNSGGIQVVSKVGENGVRLRSAPSSSAAVLELLYQNEVVIIDYKISNNISDWYFLMRYKTGTWGYTSKSYILSN